MVERKISQIINRNPNLLKIVDDMPEPYKKHICMRHWGIRCEDNDEIVYFFVPANWMELEPNIIN